MGRTGIIFLTSVASDASSIIYSQILNSMLDFRFLTLELGFLTFPTYRPSYAVMHSYKEPNSTGRHNMINELLLLLLFLFSSLREAWQLSLVATP